MACVRVFTTSRVGVLSTPDVERFLVSFVIFVA
jgi:hypothetical protein